MGRTLLDHIYRLDLCKCDLCQSDKVKYEKILMEREKCMEDKNFPKNLPKVS